MYRDGQRYLRALRAAAEGAYNQATLQPIAQAHATSVAEVRTAINFAKAVNRITEVVGAPAKKLLLSGEQALLTPVLIGQLARRTPHVVQAALRQAAGGLHPWARPVPESTPPELAVWDFHLHRLECAIHLLEAAVSRLQVRSLTPGERTGVYRDATAARVAAAAVGLALDHFTPPESSDGQAIAALTEPPEKFPRRVRKARGLVVAVTHDLPLTLTQHTPPPQAVRALRRATDTVHALAERLADLARPPAARRSA